MNVRNKTFPKLGRFLYGVGGLSVLTECVLALLFVGWFPRFGVGNISLLTASAVGIALPIAFMPVFYALINGNTAIATGKYHLPMVISALAASLSLVLMLGIGKGNQVGQAFSLMGLMFVYSLGIQVFRFCCYAVELRFDPMGSAGRINGIFSGVAVLLSAALLLWTTDVSIDYVRETVALAGMILLLSALCVYMTTVRFMPLFVRLEPFHRRPLAHTYRRFFAPLRHGAVKLIFGGDFASLAGVTLVAAAVPSFVFASVFGYGVGYYCAVAAAASVTAASAVLTVMLSAKKGASLPSTVPLVCAAVELAVAVWVIITACVSPAGVAAKVAAVTFALSSGLAVGMFFASRQLSEKHAVMCAQTTYGRYRCLYNTFAFAAFAVGLALAAATVMICEKSATAAAILTAALCGVLLTVGAVLRNLGMKTGLAEKESE